MVCSLRATETPLHVCMNGLCWLSAAKSKHPWSLEIDHCHGCLSHSNSSMGRNKSEPPCAWEIKHTTFLKIITCLIGGMCFAAVLIHCPNQQFISAQWQWHVCDVFYIFQSTWNIPQSRASISPISMLAQTQGKASSMRVTKATASVLSNEKWKRLNVLS